MPTYALTFNPDTGKSDEMLLACEWMVTREEGETDDEFLQRVARLHFLDILGAYRKKVANDALTAPTITDWPD